MKYLCTFLAVFTALVAVAPVSAATDAKLYVETSLYKKNITGARSRWEMVVKDDGSVTVNGKDAEPLSPEVFAKLKKVVSETDFAAIMKTRSTEGYASSSGGIDQQYRVKLEKMYAIRSWDNVLDPKAPFIKFMNELVKKYKPTFERMGRG